jgi:hypothetical protein
MSMVLGGSEAGDSGLAILPNGSNAAYITGATSAQNFPATVGAYQTAKLSLGSSAFVAEVTDANDTGRIVRATLLGGKFRLVERLLRPSTPEQSTLAAIPSSAGSSRS